MRKAFACIASKRGLLPLALFPRQAIGLPHSGLPLLPVGAILTGGKSWENWALAVWRVVVDMIMPLKNQQTIHLPLNRLSHWNTYNTKTINMKCEDVEDLQYVYITSTSLLFISHFWWCLGCAGDVDGELATSPAHTYGRQIRVNLSWEPPPGLHYTPDLHFPWVEQ